MRRDLFVNAGCVLIALAALAAFSGCSSTKSKRNIDLAFAAAPVATPATPTSNDTVTVNFTVVNNGSNHVGNVTWNAYHEDDVIASGTIAALGGKASTALSFLITGMEAGTHHFSVRLDPANAIPEDNEANNTAVFDITYAAAPAKVDLQFAVPLASTPVSPAASDTITLSFTLKNADTTASGAAATNVHWHLFDGSTYLGANTITSMPADGSQLQTFILSGAAKSPGLHHFSVVLDPNHTLNETDETNNTSTLDLVIAPSGTT